MEALQERRFHPIVSIHKSEKFAGGLFDAGIACRRHPLVFLVQYTYPVILPLIPESLSLLPNSSCNVTEPLYTRRDTECAEIMLRISCPDTLPPVPSPEMTISNSLNDPRLSKALASASYAP